MAVMLDKGAPVDVVNEFIYSVISLFQGASRVRTVTLEKPVNRPVNPVSHRIVRRPENLTLAGCRIL